MADGCDLLGFRAHFANSRETIIQPETVVQWKINCVQARPAVNRNGFVLINAQLHADALEEGGGEFEKSNSQIVCRKSCRGLAQNPFGRIEGRCRAAGRSAL